MASYGARGFYNDLLLHGFWVYGSHTEQKGHMAPLPYSVREYCTGFILGAGVLYCPQPPDARHMSLTS